MTDPVNPGMAPFEAPTPKLGETYDNYITRLAATFQEWVNSKFLPDAGIKKVAPAIWRHVKRGTFYTEIGRAELQITVSHVVDGSRLVIYRGEDGKLWAREESEFEDGRFERVMR